MVAGSERCHQSIALVDVKPVELDLRAPDVILNEPIGSSILEFVPTLRSGSFFDIGTRKDMEDEHIRIDDLASSLDSPFQWPAPTAFYGVFDGHGGPDAASYIQKHALRFFFQDACFPQALEFNPAFFTEVENSMRRSFLQVDLAIADDRTISSSCGTTALTALVLGRHLLVANVGDCRAVLCRQGKAVELSEDHRALHAGERKRIEICGGYIDDGYLNGVLSVTRALGDWDIKSPTGGLPSPLISEPEFKQVKLTEHDEFMIIGCDGIWDVMTSQHAVGVVRRGLRRHDDPERCARDLVLEALRLKTADNLTVIVVCFSKEHREEERPRLRYCSLSSEALCNLRKSLECDADNDDQN